MKRPSRFQNLTGQGVSLNSPQLSQRKEFLTEHLWQTPIIPPSEAIRTERWKYFRYINDPQHEELYDLNVDPLEMNNLAGNPSYLGVVKDLRQRMEEKLKAIWKKRVCST